MKLIETMNKALLLGSIKFSKMQAKLFEDILYLYSEWIEQKESEVVRENTRELWHAAFIGDRRKVQKLIPVSDPKSDGSSALSWAAMKGFTEIVKLLLPHSNPKDPNCHAVINAAENGHAEIVKLLLPHSNPKDRNFHALYSAAENGHLDIVKLVLDANGSNDNCGFAMMKAANNGQKECVRHLLKHSDVRSWRRHMKQQGQVLIDELVNEESSIADARKNATEEQLKSKIDELDVVCDLLVQVLDISTGKADSKDLAIEKINEVKRLDEEFKRYL